MSQQETRRMADQFVTVADHNNTVDNIYERILSLEKKMWVATGVGMVLTVIGGAMLAVFFSMSNAISLQSVEQASVKTEVKNVKETLLRLENRFFDNAKSP